MHVALTMLTYWKPVDGKMLARTFIPWAIQSELSWNWVSIWWFPNSCFVLVSPWFLVKSKFLGFISRSGILRWYTEISRILGEAACLQLNLPHPPNFTLAWDVPHSMSVELSSAAMMAIQDFEHGARSSHSNYLA